MPEERIEEFLIFVMGITSFLFFILKEHQLEAQSKEKLKEQRRLQQTAKDLVDSYSYIGEVNRKMDMLMKIGANLSESVSLNKKKECKVFDNILDTTIFLLKGQSASLVFYNVKTKRIIKEICSDKKCQLIKKNKDFFTLEKDIYIKVIEDYIIFSSNRSTQDVRSYLVVRGFDEFQSQDNNNQDIIKYLVMQALFVYFNLMTTIKK
ncbi:MAG: hypothetical protein WC823_05465 [Parcubacteria group bacterium]